MTVGRFPNTRMRRNRTDAWTRRLVAETKLSVDDLIWPIFIIEGSKTSPPRRPRKKMPRGPRR
jgi:porphobilinogen synthase